MKKRSFLIFCLAIMIISVGLVFLLKKDEWFFSNKKDIIFGEKFSYTPIMYKICDDNNCNYLVGAMHLGDAHIKDLSDKVINAYKEMDAIAVELDTTDYTLDVNKYLLPDGVTIDTLVSEELKKKIEKFNSEHPMFQYEQYKNYKLGFLTEILTSLLYVELGYMTEGVDTYFVKLAHNDNKEIISIETFESQETFIMNYSDDLYKYIIEDTIDTYDEQKEIIKKLYEAYLAGDVEKIKTLIMHSESDENNNIDDRLKKEAEKYLSDIYANRNVTMTAAIENYLKLDKNVFVTVGAAHVIADDGIVEILKNKGYEVTQIN